MSSEHSERVDASMLKMLRSLHTNGLLASFDYQETSKSTNADAMSWLQQNTGEPLSQNLPRLHLTDRQTSGRGRGSNVWHACDDGLAFSMTLVPQSRLISIAAGVALASTIDTLVGQSVTGLKWPNDVWVDGKKVAGILIERSGIACVIGIGLNLLTSPDLPDGSAASIFEVTRKRLSRDEAIGELVQNLIEQTELCEKSPAELLRTFESKSVLAGREVSAIVRGQPSRGTCVGIDAQGQLLLRVGGEVISVHSGEVTLLRPR